ncbi:MAG TPA: nucleotide exchange factor GrpE [Acidobacteriota bacterium]|nr:nucleotide exchange factor GrpE [Acidobacteriota bacterium]
MTLIIDPNPSESDDIELISSDDESQDSVELVTTQEDPALQLQADLDAAKSEVAEWQDRFLRKAAEFENYRKRVEKEKLDALTIAKSSVLIEFLPVLDACERALKIFDDVQQAAAGLQHYQEGVQLLYRQLLDAMGRIGVVPMEVEGKQFDPHMHEALSREENLELEENTIVKELRRGYLFKDKLLRPAQVIVAFHPVAKD